jgi:predicted RND superfamily exporter protein
MEMDMQKFFPLSMLVAAAVLLIVFRNAVSIIFPVITVLLSLVWTLGLKGMFHSPITPVSTTLFALITVIGCADSIHFITHFRIAFSKLKDRQKALLEAYARAGKPCLFTSVSTAAGFGSLTISQVPAIRHLGFFAAFGIMSAFILSMIIVPAALCYARPRPFTAGHTRQGLLSGILKAAVSINRKYSIPVLVAGFLFIGLMANGIRFIKVESALIEYLKKESKLRQSAEFLDSNLCGISSTELILEGPENTFKDPKVLQEIETLQRFVERHGQVAATYAVTDFIKLINMALNRDDTTFYCIPDFRETVAQGLLLYEMSGGEEIGHYISEDYSRARISIRTRQMNEDSLKALMTGIQEFSLNHFKPFKIQITGWDKIIHKLTQRIIATQIQSLGLAFGVILVMMLFVFGIKGGLASIIPNLFPIVFILGFMGYAGFSLNIATAIIASIAIGIVVDDTVHYFSHFRDEYRDTGRLAASMENALFKVGRALVYTSILLSLGFSVMMLSETTILFDFGLLSSLGILSALAGDMFIGPVILSKIRVFKIPPGGTGSRNPA